MRGVILVYLRGDVAPEERGQKHALERQGPVEVLVCSLVCGRVVMSRVGILREMYVAL